MKINLIIIIILINLFPSLAAAESLTFSGYADTGARATDESEYEPELNDSYTYHNYQAKMEQSFNKMAGYNFSAFLYKKDYKELNNLNNESRRYDAGIFYWLGPAVKLDLDMQYRRKRYEDNLSGDYDQLLVTPGLTWKMADKSAIGLTAGINNYNYLNRENETKRFIRLKVTKLLMADKLALAGGVGIQQLNERQQNRHRTQYETNAGLNLKTDRYWLENLSLKAEAGRGDTKDEDNDLDLDYRYWQINAGTRHNIGGKIKTDVAYEYLKKDFLLANNDFQEISINNDWNYEWLSFDLEHKEVVYRDRVKRNYRREKLGVGTRYAKRMDWNARTGIEGNYYRYENGISDKNRYYLTAGGEKVLTSQLRLGMELKWRFTDNQNSADQSDTGIRVTGEWKY